MAEPGPNRDRFVREIGRNPGHFDRTGKTAPFRSFCKDGPPLLTPKPVPSFTPQKSLGRWAGIVV